MAYRILTTCSSFGKVVRETLEMLEDEGFEVVTNPHGRKLTKEESLELMPGFDGMIAGTEKLDREVLASVPGLKYICRLGTGMDNVDMEAAKELGIVVENTPDAHVKGVAEITLAGILSVARHLHIADARLKNGTWKKHMGRLLEGKKIGLIGLGRVAKHLVRLLQPFQPVIYAIDPYPDHEFANEYGVEFMGKDELIAKSEVISLHIPYTAENDRYIDTREFELMRNDVMLINASRGGLVNEEELFRFLSDNKQAFAYVDTFSSEPYSGQLTTLDNILLTPHIGSSANETRIEMEKAAAQNVINHFNK